MYKRKIFSAVPYTFYLCYCKKNKAVENIIKDHKARLVPRHPQVKKKKIKLLFLDSTALQKETRINVLRSFNFKDSSTANNVKQCLVVVWQKGTTVVFNLVFNREKSREAFGKSMGKISNCHRYVALREYQQCLGEARGEAVVGKSPPPNCQENHRPVFRGERFGSKELQVIKPSAQRRSSSEQ